MKKVIRALPILMLSLVLSAQTQSPPAPSKVQTVAFNPGTFIAFGGGLQGGSAGASSAWADYCRKTTESVYSCLAIDLIGKTRSTRAGLETIIMRRGDLRVAMKADAGASTSPKGIGAAYGAGLSAIYALDKAAKVPGVYAVVSVSILQQNVAASPGLLGKQTVIRIGIGKAF